LPRIALIFGRFAFGKVEVPYIYTLVKDDDVKILPFHEQLSINLVLKVQLFYF